MKRVLLFAYFLLSGALFLSMAVSFGLTLRGDERWYGLFEVTSVLSVRSSLEGNRFPGNVKLVTALSIEEPILAQIQIPIDDRFRDVATRDPFEFVQFRCSTRLKRRFRSKI